MSLAWSCRRAAAGVCVPAARGAPAPQRAQLAGRLGQRLLGPRRDACPPRPQVHRRRAGVAVMPLALLSERGYHCLSRGFHFPLDSTCSALTSHASLQTLPIRWSRGCRSGVGHRQAWISLQILAKCAHHSRGAYPAVLPAVVGGRPARGVRLATDVVAAAAAMAAVPLHGDGRRRRRSTRLAIAAPAVVRGAAGVAAAAADRSSA